MEELLRLLVLVHRFIYLSFQVFQFVFVVNYFPILLLPEQGLKVVDLLLKPLLMEVYILMHLSLCLHKHVRYKFLNPRHHDLRFYSEVILFPLNCLLLFIVVLDQVLILLLDSAKKLLSVLCYWQDFLFVHLSVPLKHGIIGLDAVLRGLSIAIIVIIVPFLDEFFVAFFAHCGII